MREGLRCTGFRRFGFWLHTVLHTNRGFFGDFDGLGGAFFRDVVIDPEDHFFIRMSEPDHGLVHIDTRVPKEPSAIRVPEVMRTETDFVACGGGQDESASTVLLAVTCPKCGASTIPDAFGCCEYCGGAIYG